MAGSTKAFSYDARLSKIQILIIDSSETILDMFKEMLKNLGFNSVYTVSNGSKGVTIMKKIKINLVITDREIKVNEAANSNILPINASMFVKRIRNSEASPNPFVPVLMLMEDINKQGLQEARDAGVNEIVPKPIEAEQLCSRLLNVIDHPRVFITSELYKGPCRRFKNQGLPAGKERRKRELRVVRYDEFRRK